tara:strand:- start:405 stop:608 length:204 start_codon:yes stop_codon:yes gene_type:complete
MKEKNKHCHYSGLPSPAAYERDDIDYDGMGNQGRVPKQNDNTKDYFIMALIATICITWSLVLLSIFI